MIADLPHGGFTVHGGRLAEARARFGGAPGDWLDLSTGINPEPWPGADRIPIDWRGLPDPAALALLEQTAAAFFAADPALCCAVPGSEAGLRLVARILGLPGRHMPLTYGSHADAFADNGIALAGAPSASVIANPNNPDGRVTPPVALHRMLAAQEAAGGWLIVDEAFAECRGDRSIAADVRVDSRLIVLRSFGKFFGLAGVRLGFVIAPPAVLGPLRRLLGEWPVCAAALAFGTAAYADSGWIAATRHSLPRRAAGLDAVLRRHGLEPQGDCPLFRLTESNRAGDIFVELARRHVLTRPFAAHPTLLRFGVPAGDAALARLDGALAKGMRHG